MENQEQKTDENLVIEDNQNDFSSGSSIASTGDADAEDTDKEDLEENEETADDDL